MEYFHAHVYFHHHELKIAAKLREKLQSEFSDSIEIGKIEETPRGPHVVPQFFLRFNEYLIDEIMSWLRIHRGGLSVLIHPDIQDELKSHQDDAIWLGPPMPLRMKGLDMTRQ